jgi:hypothetical protein
MEINLTKTEFDALNEKARLVSTQAAQDVLAERRRQVDEEGWDADHDDEHDEGELGMAAACYAMEGASNLTLAGDEGEPPSMWPWDEEWWKPSPEPRRNLVKAAALILAEIDRLDRQA